MRQSRLPGLDCPGLKRRHQRRLFCYIFKVGSAQACPTALEEVVALNVVIPVHACQPVIHLTSIQHPPLIRESVGWALPGGGPVGFQEIHRARRLNWERAEGRDYGTHIRRGIAHSSAYLPATYATVHRKCVRPMNRG